MTISTNVNLITHDNSAIKCFENGTDFVKKYIGNNCFIGNGAIILPGVSIAENAIVGSGSVVTKSVIKSGIVIAGNPAHEIGCIKDILIKRRENVFDFRGKNSEQKKNEMLINESKWIVK